MRRLLLLLLKAATSTFLLYISLRSVNLEALGARLSHLNPFWIAAALIVQAVQVGIQAFRWREIAIACGAQLTSRMALRINFIAQFFNQVLPSTIGGDAARIWLLARVGGGWARATYSVLIDRLAGIFALALIVILCLPWTLTIVADPVARAILLLISAAAIGGFFFFIGIGVVRLPLLTRWAPTRHLVEVSQIVWRLCRSWHALGFVGILSLAVHAMSVASAWCLVQSVAASASFFLLLFIIPPVILIATVPVSIAGWGLREGSMIVAFSYAGLAAGDGLSVSVLIGITALVTGATGGIVWIQSDVRLAANGSIPPPPTPDQCEPIG